MPVNLMADFSNLAPTQNFYEAFMSPLLQGQELSKQAMANQITRESLPFNIPMLQQELLKSQLANQQSQTMMPYIAPRQEAEIAGLNLSNQQAQAILPYLAPQAQAQLLQTQLANQMQSLNISQQPELFRTNVDATRAATLLNQMNAAQLGYKLQHPWLMAPNEMASLLMSQGAYGGNQGNPGGAGVTPYGMPLTAPAPGTPEASQAYGTPVTPSATSLVPSPNSAPIGQPSPATAAPAQGAPAQGAPAQGIPEGLSSKAADMQSIRSQAGLVAPSSSLLDNAYAAKGLNPQLKTQIEQYNMASNEDRKRYDTLFSDAFSANNSNSVTGMQANDFINKYRKANEGIFGGAVGPFGSKLSNLSPAAQAAEKASASLTPLIAKTLNTGHLTDSFLRMVADSKASIEMHPQVAESAYQKIISAVDRGNAFQPFLLQAQAKGVPSLYAETMWQQFQADYPLTGNYELDRKSLKTLNNYTNPENIQKVINGTYVSPSARSLEDLSVDELNALPLDRKIELEKIHEAEKKKKAK